MSTQTGWLAVTVEAQQRMSMGKGSGRAFHTDTHPHVPGSVLRGAIARSWLVDGATTDATFRDVFDRHLRFGPLFAEGTDLRPLSVRHCKYEHNPTHRCDPGPHDHALPTTGPRLLSYWDTAFPPPDQERLPAGWNQPDGHWITSKGDLVTAPGVTIPTTTVTSTAIDHQRGTAADGQLFSRGAVETGTILHGLIAGHRDVLNMLATSLAEQDRLELGGRTSVLGSARISVTPVQAPTPLADGTPLTNGEQVVLRTLSPTFLLDPAGRATFDIKEELRRLRFTGTVERIWHRPITDGTGGFHAASRLPKPADIGLAAGTTVQLTLTDTDPATLTAIIEHGLGVRRPEGFGWVTLTRTPWRHPSTTPPDTGPTVPGEDVEYASLWAATRTAHLSDTQRTWLTQRLVDTTADQAGIEAALRQPGAGDLTTGQRTVVRDLLGRPGHIRRRLADQIRSGRAQ